MGSLAADGQAHTLHPVTHGTAKRHLAAAGADRLGLQIEQDHPGPGAVRHAVELGLAAELEPAGFDQEGDAVLLLFPRLIVGEPLVRQRGQAEPRARDPDALAFVGHHLRGDVDQGTLPHRHHLPCPPAAVHEDQPMDVGSVAIVLQQRLS
jgi:hypothetical protein